MKFAAATQAALLLVLIFVSATSCKKTDGGEKVTGHVSYKDAPLTDAAVIFYPEVGRNFVAALDSEGNYSVRLAPGSYSVAIAISSSTPPGWKEGDPMPPPKIVLPAQYTSRVNTPLKADVKAGQSEPIDFDLK